MNNLRWYGWKISKIYERHKPTDPGSSVNLKLDKYKEDPTKAHLSWLLKIKERENIKSSQARNILYAGKQQEESKLTSHHYQWKPKDNGMTSLTCWKKKHRILYSIKISSKSDSKIKTKTENICYQCKELDTTEVT